MRYGFLGCAARQLRAQTDAGDIRGTSGRCLVMRRRGAPGRSPSFRRRLRAEQVSASDGARRSIRGGKWNATRVPLSRTPRAVSKDRSRLMASVRQHGTAPELVVRKVAREAGLVVRTNGRSLPGSPDLFCANPPRAVFVHGCFWHRHPGCRAATTPKTHRDFWIAKFIANVDRDRRKVRQLRVLGFRVMTIWECEVRRSSNSTRLTRRLLRFFESTLSP